MHHPSPALRRRAVPTVHPMPPSDAGDQPRPDLPVLDALPVHVSCETGHVYRGTVHWFHFPTPDPYFAGPGLILVSAPGAACHHEGLVTPAWCPSCAARPVHVVHVHPCGPLAGGIE